MTYKRYLFAGLVAVAFVVAGIQVATAQTSRLYFAGYLGLNTYGAQPFTENTIPTSGDIELKNTNSFAGALGVRLSRNFRAEAELSYRKPTVDGFNVSGIGSATANGELKNWMGFLNLYYDFDVPWKIQPFIGGGVGLGWFEGEITDVNGVATSASSDTTALTWNVGGGLKYRVNPDLAFTGGYRYLDSTDLDFDSFEIDYSSHEFRVGMEWDLPVR